MAPDRHTGITHDAITETVSDRGEYGFLDGSGADAAIDGGVGGGPGRRPQALVGVAGIA